MGLKVVFLNGGIGHNMLNHPLSHIQVSEYFAVAFYLFGTLIIVRLYKSLLVQV